MLAQIILEQLAKVRDGVRVALRKAGEHFDGAFAKPDDGVFIPPAPVYIKHSGKGRNKHPHRFSGVAAAKRAARKHRAQRKGK